MARKPALPDAALVVAGLTGIWFLLGFTRHDAYHRRLGVPAQSIMLSPQQYVLDGFFSSLLILVAAVLALFVSASVGESARQKHPAKASDAARAGVPSLSERGLVLLLLGSWFYAMSHATSFGRKPIVVAGWSLGVTPAEIALAILLVVASAAWARMRSRLRRSVPASVGDLLPAVQALAVLAALVLVVMGASFEGRSEASDQVWRVAPYDVVTFHASADETLDNATFFFIAKADGGYYVRELDDIGGKTHAARFVSEALIGWAEFERVFPD